VTAAIGALKGPLHIGLASKQSQDTSATQLRFACRLTQLWHNNARKGPGIASIGYIGQFSWSR
jgi:hypothetical protein